MAWTDFRVHNLVCVLGFVCGLESLLGVLPGMSFRVGGLPGMSLGCITWYVFEGLLVAWNDFRVRYLV